MKVTSLIAGLGLSCLLAAASPVFAAGGASGLTEHANNDVANTRSLQRGARNFMNYCVGCHSMQYMRYNRIAQDLGLSEEQLKDNLIFGVDKINENVTTAMTTEQAKAWFGAVPPDLSLTARSRGADWIYTYLKAFYVDDSRPFGVNNMLLQGASMPHVLWELQGAQKAVYRTEDKTMDDGSIVPVEVFDRFEQITPGTLSAEDYDGFVRDTVNFMDYVGEPMQLKRKRTGMLVLGFLLVMTLLTYLLKKEYWKDVH